MGTMILPQLVTDETACLETLVEDYHLTHDRYRDAAEDYILARVRPSGGHAARVSLDSLPQLEEVNRLAGELANLEVALAAAGGRLDRRHDGTIRIYGDGALLAVV